jgi:hypothetical protein
MNRRLRIAAPSADRPLDLTPQGFLLSEAALYSFFAQDVYPDVFSFCSAIPDHLKQLFLIPVRLEPAVDPGAQALVASIASRLAGEAIPTGDTPEGDLFSYRTVNYLDGESTVPSSDPGSIFDIDGADEITHHQEFPHEQDINVQVPSETSYMTDVDVTESDMSYPYRTDERPVRHSSLKDADLFHYLLKRQLGQLDVPNLVIAARGALRFALKPVELEPKAPGKIKENAESCSVSLVSYDKRGRVFTFDVDCGNGAKNVRASLTDLDHVAMTCDCPFWRYNGPEYAAKNGGYMLGLPHGTASPPDVRDPDRQYYLCKHTYAVLKRLDEFVSQVAEENWEADEEEILKKVDEDWEEMAGVAEVPIDEFEDDVVVDWDEPGEDGDVEDADPGDLDADEVVPDEDLADDDETSDVELEDEDEDEDEDESEEDEDYPDIDGPAEEPEEPEEPEADEEEDEDEDPSPPDSDKK